MTTHVRPSPKLLVSDHGMKKNIVFMFSGQGSQYYRMGKELYTKHPRFRFWMDHCDAIVQPLIHDSLVDVLYLGPRPSDVFDEIIHTNPALLCMEYCLAQILMEMGVRPDYVLGYSLGEFTSAIISGCLTLEDGIKIAVGLARLVELKTEPAEMLAVIAPRNILTDFPEIFRECWLTGVNFQGSFVVSGFPCDIGRLQEELRRRLVVFQKLPVNYGFHTEIIDPIEGDFKRLVGRMNLAPAGIPIVSSLKSEVVYEFSTDHCWNVVRHPVDFENTIISMLEQGAFVFIDVGPSGTLATFVRYLLPSGSGSVTLQTMNQFGRDLDCLQKLKSSLGT